MRQITEADWQPFLQFGPGRMEVLEYTTRQKADRKCGSAKRIVSISGDCAEDSVGDVLIICFYSYDDPRENFSNIIQEISIRRRPTNKINLDYNQALTICYEICKAALNGENPEDELEMLEDRSKRYAPLSGGSKFAAERWSAYLSRITACSLLSDEKIQKSRNTDLSDPDEDHRSIIVTP